MFDWLKKFTAGGSGLSQMTRDLERMIQEGRHAFDLATSVFVGGADPEFVREDLHATDQRIDELEMSIRRQIVVHGSVYGSAHLPEMMVLMSVAKDAERIGDLAENIFNLSRFHSSAPGKPHHEELRKVRQMVSNLLADAPELYELQDKEKAEAFIQRAFVAIDACKEAMGAIFMTESCTGYDATCAVVFRHIRRIAAHVQNIITAVVNPVDKLDFLDEPERE